MKRRDFLKLSAAAALTGMAAACGAAPSASASFAPAASSAASTPASSAASSAAASSGAGTGRTLVACYSATGHTAAVAGYIADATGADLFLLQPVDPYTDEELDYNDSGSRVSQEHADPSLQTVELEAVTPEGWADYDTVFVGCPIWWGRAGWPVNGFVTGNDFSGKRSAPRPARAWAAAPKTWPSWPAPATGKRGCASAPRPARATWPNGWLGLRCKRGEER